MKNCLCLSLLWMCFALAALAQAPSSSCVLSMVHVHKPDTGWDVSIFDFHHKTREVPLHGELEQVVRTDYAILGGSFLFTQVLADTCQHEATLKPLYLRVMRASGFALNGKTFALTMSGEIGDIKDGHQVPWMGVTEITLVDTTGTGKFDLLEWGMGPDSIPAWVSTNHQP